MSSDRWTLALDEGLLTLPEGRVLVHRARGDAELAPLGEVHAVQGFRPDHDRLAARGLDVARAPEGEYAAALVQIVKSKPETLSLITDALSRLPAGAPLMVDGQKTDGIESILRAVRAELPVADVISKAHGKLFWLNRPETLPPTVEAWRAEPAEVLGETRSYLTAPGLFSADGPDAGSELLVALVPELKGRVADLGAGWGYIAAEVLAEQDKIETLDLHEAEWAALELARENVTDPRAGFHWTDVQTMRTGEPYDAVLSNPPFHTGRAADPSLGRGFIAAAARILKPSGRFFMVANRHLPYEAALKEHFGSGRVLAEVEGYKLFEASRPQADKRRRRKGRDHG